MPSFHHVADMFFVLPPGPVTIEFDETDIRVMEDGGNIFVAVSLLQPVALPVSVDISYIPGTADTDGRSTFSNFILNVFSL